MARTTVYVPDDLWERVQKAQDQGIKLNISEIVQDALRRELDRRTQRVQRFPDLEQRLRLDELRRRFDQQRAELYQVGYALGIDFANEWLHYADLVLAQEVGWDAEKVVRYLVPRGHPFEEKFLQEAEACTIGRGPGGTEKDMSQGFVDALRRVLELVGEGASTVKMPSASDLSDA